MSGEQLFTPDEAADYLRVSRATIYRLTDEGRLPYSEVEGGRGRRYRGDDLRRLVPRPDQSRIHAALAKRFGLVHDELEAAIHELYQVANDFGLGWEGHVHSPAFWTQIRDRAATQMEAHRDLSRPGSLPVERLFDQALLRASIQGHQMEPDVRGVDTAHAKCTACGAQLTVGHPLGGGELQLVVKNAVETTCSVAVSDIVRLFTQWERAATRSPNQKVASSAPLDPPTAEAVVALLPRLHELRQRLTDTGLDQHDRPVVNVEANARAWLWEEWRDAILGERNGYRDVWAGPDDPLYGGTSRRSR
jgi:excisionase family DNA binding protein